MKYDIIIAGAGCAGLSLAHRLCDEKYSNLNVLIIDKDSKTKNDRTWCFWGLTGGLYNDIIHKSWDQVHFHSKTLDKELKILPYKYHMIRGKDFYDYTMDIINKSAHVNFIQDTVKAVKSLSDNHVSVNTQNEIYESSYCFKSYLDKKPELKNDWYVDQHFGGWFIETKTDIFNSEKATFMDFRIEQESETRFFYVLPTSKNTGLVEMAVFSNNPLSNDTYDQYIEQYIKQYLTQESFKIHEKEYGIIPMTSYSFQGNQAKNIFNIGTAAGAVKPSSGYAFYRIQEHCNYIIKHIEEKKIKPIAPYFKNDRYRLYDKIMLNVMLSQKAKGEQIFTSLFKKLPAKLVLKFLNQHTSFFEELRIFTAPPWAAFTKAMLEELKK